MSRLRQAVCADPLGDDQGRDSTAETPFPSLPVPPVHETTHRGSSLTERQLIAKASAKSFFLNVALEPADLVKLFHTVAKSAAPWDAIASGQAFQQAGAQGAALLVCV